MSARVPGMALVLLTAAATIAQSQDSASSPEQPDYPRTATVHRPSQGFVPEVAAVYHRHQVFAIPFAINQNSPAPMDIILYASVDLGATWDAYSRQPTSQKQFVFRAGKDGEYWFTSQLIGAGVATPNPGTFAPQLRIIVDTQPPRLMLDAKSEPGGMVQVTWEAHDESLLPDQVVLQVQNNPGQPWKPLELQSPATDPLQRTMRGETRFQPDRGATLVTVRLEARDAADNVAELTRRLFLPLNITSAFGSPATPPPTSEVPADPFAQHGFAASQPEQPAELNLPPPPSGQHPVFEQADPQSAPSTPSDRPSAYPPSSGPFSQDSQPASDPSAVAWPSRETNEEFRDSVPVRDVSSSRSMDAEHPADAPVSETKPLVDSSPFPEGERPRMTNSKRFNLDYSIDAVGPQGVEKVELWVTRNSGQDWEFWSADENRESPMLVEVQEEGIYGFRIVIVGKNGLTSQAPRPGDPADLWVGVDTTRPVVEITSAAYGQGEYAGHLDIRWNAVDSGFGARPITLLFSDQPQGPWNTIASGLPNTGQHYWRVDSRVPEKFYLKIEARDEAGNLGESQLTEPIHSAGLSPRGRIRNVEAVD